MANVKKRLKNIEATLSRFAGDEKRIVDLIVGLTTEQVENRLQKRLDVLATRIRDEVVQDIEKRFPDQKDVEDTVERAMRRALDKQQAGRPSA